MSPCVSNEEHSMMSCVVASRSMAWEKKKLASLTFIHDRHVLKAQAIRSFHKSVVLQLHVVFLI